MKITAIVILLVLCKLAKGSTLVVDPVENHRDENYGKTSSHKNTFPSECPEEECMKKCPMFGHVKKEDGCPDCEECVKTGLFGDIIIGTEQQYYDTLERFGMKCDDNKDSRAAHANLQYKWSKSNGVVEVPYVFESSVSSSHRDTILRHLEEYNQATCIRIVPYTGQRNYVSIQGGDVGCSSYVGMIGGKQQITLGRGCLSAGTIQHEMMHALGFWHEQSRSDRDRYVNIIWSNILDGTSSNFEKQSQDKIYNSYNIDSIMHYDGFAFSTNYGVLPTITDKQGNPIRAQRNGFSQGDLEQINAHYECDGYYGGGNPTSTQPTTTRSTTRATTTRATTTRATTTRATTTRATTTRATTTIATTSGTGEGKCEDDHKHCVSWRDSNYCTHQTYRKYMMKNCQRACGICTYTGTEVCVDSDPESCPIWSTLKYCDDDRYMKYMRSQCQRSCGTCPGQVTTEPTTLGPEQCEDKRDTCGYWKGQGYCSNEYVQYMRANCKASCGICAGGTTTQPTTTTSPVATTSGVSYFGSCGIPAVSLQFSHRIIGGVNAQRGSIPWMATLYNRHGSAICGASLISSEYLITAAHCFDGQTNPSPSNYYTILGKHNLNRQDSTEIRVSFSRITVHPQYNHQRSTNDIAIIKLASPVVFNDYIRPVCLPSQNQELIKGTVALVSGWGNTQTGQQYVAAEQLQQVDVIIQSNEDCNAWLQTGGEVTDDMVCAGYQQGEKDSCQGDSGGPLMIEDITQNRFVLVGIVSWGYECAQVNRPGVYQRVAHHIPWITANTSG